MEYDLPQTQYIIGDTAVKIAMSIESAIRNRRLSSNETLPTVRELAQQLEVSPATVAAAYRSLRTRGLVITDGRRGTRVSPHLAAAVDRPTYTPPAGTVNLADGNPDPALLPNMAEALRSIDPSPCLYGQPPHHPELIEFMKRELRQLGVMVKRMCVVSGALEGIDRVMAEHLRPGDRVAVEDPGFTGILDLLVSRGLSLLPVRVDDQGMLPGALHDAVQSGASALVITPRVQSPTGAALNEERARELQRVLQSAPELLIVQDDHARLITDAPLHCLHTPSSSRWAYVHSFSKALNPDLRLAVITGDENTMSRIARRMLLTERWVSHILQRTVLHLLTDATVRRQLQTATTSYNTRRQALLDALRDRDIAAHGESGFNVWVPVREETSTIQSLAEAGWAVSPGERYRLSSPPGIRITASRLQPDDAQRVADTCAAVLSPDPAETSV